MRRDSLPHRGGQRLGSQRIVRKTEGASNIVGLVLVVVAAVVVAVVVDVVVYPNCCCRCFSNFWNKGRWA